jgi:hypothetical protein
LCQGVADTPSPSFVHCENKVIVDLGVVAARVLM